MRLSLPFFLAPVLASSAVTSVQIGARADIPGTSYERIAGIVHFAADPTLPANSIVQDVSLAPRNPAGKVEYSSDFYILKPRDPARSNGALIFEVSNRGGKGLISHFDLAPGGPTPGTAEGDLGDRYLLDQGYTIVWVGWQFDVPRGRNLLGLESPIAKNSDGTPIRGRIRSDFVLDKASSTASLADMGHLPYLAIDDGTAQLTVRNRAEDPRQTIPGSRWSFTADRASVTLSSGFEPGRIYEVIYTAENPPIVGLGPAAIRDFISYLKYGGADTPLKTAGVKRAIGYGISQSGRFLRNFLYDGFNADESGRIVFDGVWARVAGAGRGNFNYRFAQPSRDARPFLNFFYPVDIFPFTNEPETDPLTGTRGGLLDRAKLGHNAPKIFLTNGSYEYWGRAAALIHTTADGKHDLAPGPDTRIYFLAGTQHTPGHLPAAVSGTRFPANPDDYRFILRALLNDFNAWLKDGTEPPPSRYPRLAARELAPPAALRFPNAAGATPPATYHKAYHVRYGTEPPEVGPAFPTLVPALDADGNELGGVRLPELQVPLGIYTGWNYRAPGTGAPDEMASFIGSYFAYPAAEIQNRYRSEDMYVEKIRAAAQSLVTQRFLLERDIPLLIDRARREWDLAHAGLTQ